MDLVAGFSTDHICQWPKIEGRIMLLERGAYDSYHSAVKYHMKTIHIHRMTTFLTTFVHVEQYATTNTQQQQTQQIHSNHNNTKHKTQRTIQTQIMQIIIL